MTVTPRATTSLRDLAIDYVELYVEDLDATAFSWVDRYGFTVAGTGGSPEHRSIALRHGQITLVLTEATSDQHPASSYVLTHGDGIADIALRTTDVPTAVDTAVANGAQLHRPPTRHTGAGPDVTAVVSGFGDVVHTLVQRQPGVGPGLPVGFVPALRPETTLASEVGLVGVDHIAVCVESGSLDPTVEYYRTALNFQHTFTERITVGSQVMESKVVRSSSGSVTLALLEPGPDSTPGQADEFLKSHHGSGVQHIAFATEDAVRTVRVLERRGVDFLVPSSTYYDTLGERITPRGHAVEDLRAARLLADEDHDGQLFQVFTRSTHPRRTLFFEIVERQGAATFGSENVRALYEALELERTGPQ